jgi:hypothetical protein
VKLAFIQRKNHKLQAKQKTKNTIFLHFSSNKISRIFKKMTKRKNPPRRKFLVEKDGMSGKEGGYANP